MIVLQLSDNDFLMVRSAIQNAREISISPNYWRLLEEILQAQAEAQRNGQFVQCGLCHDGEITHKILDD